MGEEAVTVVVASEVHKASMVTLFGVTFNIYAAILIVIFTVFLIAIYRAQRAHRFDWMDMITRDGTKISATKILQLVGGIVVTFIVIKLTLQGQLDWDIFAIYLGYVASIDGFSDDSAVGTREYDRHRGRDRYIGSSGYRDFDEAPRSRSKQKPVKNDSPEDFAEFEVNGGAKAGFDDD